MDVAGKSNPAKPLGFTEYDPYQDTPSIEFYPKAHAAPLVQIFSAFVSTKFDECQIYGHIRATELKDGTSFDLYNRDASECETILKDDCLSLSGPEGVAILGNTNVTIDVSLKDRTRNMDLITGQYHLDCVSEDFRDKLMKGVIHGEHGSVCLYYTTFRFAVYGIVEVSICKNRHLTGRFDDVHGSLVVSYSNNRQYCGTDDEVKYLETKLFEKPSDKPVRVVDRFPIKLLRHAIVMPAYSSLVIKVELSSSHGHHTSALVEFPVHGPPSETIPFENGHVDVAVKWKIAYSRMYKESVVRRIPTHKCSESNTMEPSRKAARVNIFSDQPLVSSSNPNCKSKIRTWQGLEIFTVYIGGINNEVSTVYGSIEVNDGSGYFHIYNTRQSKAEPLFDDNTVSLELHKAIFNLSLNIVLDLNDPVNDLNISRSEIGWNDASVVDGYGLSWLDKRICSVAIGASGYAALHYMMIDKAIQATLEVSLICDDNLSADAPLNLYGLICARYGEHEYSTEYEKVYYKSRLFNKQRYNPEMLSAGELKVRLIKSVMVVPLSSSLIIEADLRLVFNGNSQEEIVKGEKEFLIDFRNTCTKNIGEGAFGIKVSVTFSNLCS